jgi:hypothetical protein
MTSKIGIQLGVFGVAIFGLWYFMRRTELGSGFSRDMWNLPQQFGVMEGLRSAQEAFRQ